LLDSEMSDWITDFDPLGVHSMIQCSTEQKGALQYGHILAVWLSGKHHWYLRRNLFVMSLQAKLKYALACFWTFLRNAELKPLYG
jgi:hypothetical protein